MTSPTSRSTFRADIQGLRAIAVGLVLLYHAGLPFLPGGYVGVDVFFVISGFLITGHLMQTVVSNGRIDFGQFYARRARRILPAAFAVAVLTVIATVIFVPVVDAVRMLKDAVATVLYVPNVWFAIQQTDYLADHAPSPFQHYWSLGIEEQFYLLWPLMLWLIVLLCRRRHAGVVTVVAIIAVVSCLAGIWLTAHNQPYAFFMLPTRAWELLVGALVALLVRGGVFARVPAALRASIGWAGLTAVIAAGVVFDSATPFPGSAALLPVLGTAAVIAAGSTPTPSGPGPVLSVRPAQFIGRISYSLYLVHWPLLVIPQAAIGLHRPLPLWLTFLLGVAVAVPAAYLLYRFVEEPLRAPRALTTRRPRVTLWLTLLVTTVIAALIAATIVWAERREVPVGPDAPALSDSPIAPPPATAVLPANLRPSLDSVAEDVPVVYADGCHHDVPTETVQRCVYGAADAGTRIAVFGDSHAAQWFPAVDAIAQARGDTSVASYTKSSCPAVAVTVIDKDVPYAACDRWRAAVLDALVTDPPDVVVLSSYSGYRLAGIADGDRGEAWASGLAETIAALRAAGAAVVVIADTPRFTASPVTCLAATPHDVLSCAGERAVALDADLATVEAETAAASGAAWVDLSQYLCDAERCPVIIDDLLVYRDVNHLTVRAVRYLAPALKPAVDTALIRR